MNRRPKSFLFLLTIFLGISRVFAADITVDNNPGAVADFANLQAAIESATDGDRIIIAGSPTNYGQAILYVYNAQEATFTMKNNLTFIGPGYFRDENGAPPNASAINDPASFSLFLGADSNDRDLDGLTVIGCQIGLSTQGDNSNVLIDRCYITGFIKLSGETNVNFTRCYFANALEIINSNNCSVTNSIVGGLTLKDSAIASHCVIRGDFYSASGICLVDATSSLSNCIIDMTLISAQNYPPNIIGSVTHTIGVGGVAGLPAGGSNIDNQTLTDVVVGTGSPDAKWSLAANSPASNAASDGTDIGAFGSASPYLLSGLSGAPTITRLLVPAIASPTTGLTVEVDIEQPTN